MALIASLFAVIGRFLGRVVTMALGWASILLFGRVPESKQLLLALLSFGSLAWIIAILGTLLPDLGSFLLTAAPVPAFIAEDWVRLAMLVAALVLPLLIGVGGLLLMEAGDRPSRTGLIVQVLRGYPYAAVLAVTLAFMAQVLYRLRLQVERNLVTGRGPRDAREAGMRERAGAALSTQRGGLVGETVSAAVIGVAAAAVNALFRRTPLARLEGGAETAERERRGRRKAASQL